MSTIKKLFNVIDQLSGSLNDAAEAISCLAEIGMDGPEPQCKGMTITGDASFKGDVECENLTVGMGVKLEGDEDQNLSVGAGVKVDGKLTIDKDGGSATFGAKDNFDSVRLFEFMREMLTKSGLKSDDYVFFTRVIGQIENHLKEK